MIKIILSVILVSSILPSIAFSTPDFFPADYNESEGTAAWGKLMIENSILTKNSKSSQVIIWDVSSLTIDENFWGDRGFLINDFYPANCIEWTYEGYEYSLSCIYYEYEVFTKNPYTVCFFPIVHSYTYKRGMVSPNMVPKQNGIECGARPSISSRVPTQHYFHNFPQ